MNKEDLLKEIMKFPKVETINPISTMNSINIDDLMSAVDRLNKVPDYNDLLKENKQLKDNWDKLKKWLCEEHYLYVSEIAKNSTYQVVLNKMQELERGSDSNVKD